MENYYKIAEHYENCFKRFGDSNKGNDWPNLPDLLKRFRVLMELIRRENNGKDVNLLDFGCGTALLYDYLIENGFENIKYTGFDINKNVIDYAKSKHPELTFYCGDLLKKPDTLDKYDYIVMNGVFTEKRELKFTEMFDYMQKVLKILFEKCNKGLAFNVMSKFVDWEREDLFHLPTDTLIDFMIKNLSRHFVIRNDYGLYEYMVYLYKDAI